LSLLFSLAPASFPASELHALDKTTHTKTVMESRLFISTSLQPAFVGIDET
jgi:hypothetical protein